MNIECTQHKERCSCKKFICTECHEKIPAEFKDYSTNRLVCIDCAQEESL